MNRRRRLVRPILAACLAAATAAPGLAAGAPFPAGREFHCDWKFLSGPRQGQQGTSSIRFTLSGSAAARSGRLATWGPDWSLDQVTRLSNSRWQGAEKLWRVEIDQQAPKPTVACVLRTHRSQLIFEGCTNGAWQRCVEKGHGTASTAGVGQPYIVLTGLYLEQDHEGWPRGKPEIELFHVRFENNGTITPDSMTNLRFDGGTHTDAAGRQVRLPDVNDKNRWYTTHVAIGRFDAFNLLTGFMLVESDTEAGKLNLRHLENQDVSVTCEVTPDFGCTPSADLVGLLFGTGDDAFRTTLVITGGIDHHHESTRDLGEWRARFQLVYF